MHHGTPKVRWKRELPSLPPYNAGYVWHQDTLRKGKSFLPDRQLTPTANRANIIMNRVHEDKGRLSEQERCIQAAVKIDPLSSDGFVLGSIMQLRETLKFVAQEQDPIGDATSKLIEKTWATSYVFIYEIISIYNHIYLCLGNWLEVWLRSFRWEFGEVFGTLRKFAEHFENLGHFSGI